jgi:hypothetical protein
MLKIQGDIKSARQIESLIKNGTLFMSISFGTRLYHLGLNAKDMQGIDTSSFYTRQYEIIGDKEAAEKAKINYGFRFAALIHWLMLHNPIVEFRWDYRTNQAEIRVSPDDWRRLKLIIPELTGKWQDVAPNRIKLVEDTKAIPD